MKSLKRMVLTGVLMVAACGGGGDDNTADRMIITTGPDAGEGPGDPDAGGGPVTCTATESYGAATIGNQSAVYNMTPNPDLLAGFGTLNDDTTPDVFQVELYKGFGPFMTGEIVPGTYQLTGAELDYATCGVCVRILSDLNTANGEYVDDYFQTGGTVTITSVSPNLTLTVSNITLEHVTINPQTFESTPVGDGCESAITSGSFDAVTMMQM
jgi:hypothetical protein